jgi:hypothetical protein
LGEVGREHFSKVRDAGFGGGVGEARGEVAREACDGGLEGFDDVRERGGEVKNPVC